MHPESGCKIIISYLPTFTRQLTVVKQHPENYGYSLVVDIIQYCEQHNISVYNCFILFIYQLVQCCIPVPDTF